MRKRLLAAIMAMMLTFTLVPATGAAEGKPADRIMNNAYRSKGDFEPSALRKPMGAVRAGALPSSYSSVEQGYLTQVKDQNPYGTCWTFAALAASEADAIKNEGADASNLDLSELHLAYFSYSKKTDPLGGLDGDVVRVTMGDFLNIGGNNNIAINTLANWTGAADESIAPYGTTSTTMTIDEKVRFLDKYHLRNAYVYALPNDADAVKQAVMKYGAAATSIWYDMSNGYNGQYLYQNAKTIENHAVTMTPSQKPFLTRISRKTTERGLSETVGDQVQTTAAISGYRMRTQAYTARQFMMCRRRELMTVTISMTAGYIPFTIMELMRRPIYLRQNTARR